LKVASFGHCKFLEYSSFYEKKILIILEMIEESIFGILI